MRAVLLISVFLVLAVAIVIVIGDSNEKYINEWASEHNYHVKKVEKAFFTHGPFWLCDDDQTIYVVTVRNKYEKEYVVWFRLPKGLGQDAWAWDELKHPIEE